MGWLLILLLCGVLAAIAVSRRSRAQRQTRAATVELRFESGMVVRRTADGRKESARWSNVSEVEFVRTPVKTADGANQFILVGEDPEHGCLIPLGIGHDPELIRHLAMLDGFSVERFHSERRRAGTGRKVIWTRSPA